MEYFITGKPGNGKTLYTIATLHKLATESGRQVFYDGVPLTDEGKEKLQWKEFDVNEAPNKLPDGRLRIWPSVPDGSIVVVDEVQRYWRQRKQGGAVPLTVQAIETHRHFGLDLYFVSQDPQLVDINVRKLCWEHTHIKRAFGMELATLHRWKQRVASVDSKNEYADCLEEQWRFPKKYYGWYKSAEQHTAGKQLPWRQFAWIGGIAAAFGLALWWVFASYSGDTVAPSTAGELERTVDASSRAPGRKRGDLVNPWDADFRRARIPSIDQSAPMYDALQDARSQPVIAGCMSLVYGDGTIDCRCHSSQGSILALTVRQCRDLMKRGWFDPTKPPVDLKAENIARLDARDSATGETVGAHGEPAQAASAPGKPPQGP